MSLIFTTGKAHSCCSCVRRLQVGTAWKVHPGCPGHVLLSFGCSFLKDHGEDSASRLMQSISENQSCEQMALHFLCFSRQIFYHKCSQRVNQTPSGQGNIQFYWIILRFLQMFCWCSAPWRLLELEVTCTSLLLNKSFFSDYFLTPFLTHLYVWPQHQPVAMSNTIMCCVEDNFLLLALRPSAHSSLSLQEILSTQFLVWMLIL